VSTALPRPQSSEARSHNNGDYGAAGEFTLCKHHLHTQQWCSRKAQAGSEIRHSGYDRLFLTFRVTIYLTMMAVAESILHRKLGCFVNNELEIMLEDAALASMRYYSGTFPYGLKTTQTFSEDSQSQSRDTLFYRK
jgi:hypothetical protein